MFKAWKFILFFLLCLGVALVINLPVQQVLAQAKIPPKVRMSGVGGTLFKGRIEVLTLNRFALQAVQYRFMPSCLVSMKVCYRVDYDQGKIMLAYDLLNGDSELDGSQIEYPAAEVFARMQLALPVKPGGSLQLELDELSMRRNKVTRASGRLLWRNLGVDQGDTRINIGDYQLDFDADTEEYKFDFSDLDADLDLSGDGSITADGSYQVDVRVAAESSLDSEVRSVLELIGKRSSVNRYRIAQQGRLSAKIVRQLFPKAP